MTNFLRTIFTTPKRAAHESSFAPYDVPTILNPAHIGFVFTDVARNMTGQKRRSSPKTRAD
jgi:hypothetical protein